MERAEIPASTPKLKFGRNGHESVLFDSYELKAVSHELNRALRRAQGLASPYPYMPHGKSTFTSYTRCMGFLYGRQGKARKQVTYKMARSEKSVSQVGEKAQGLWPRLWKKLFKSSR
ncbi:hypothetical protein AMTRI_Chr10g225130 [Amborella trichopoda]